LQINGDACNIEKSFKKYKFGSKYLEDNYWKTRTNQPYKSALKDVMTDQEYYKKNFNKDKPEELIVYKTTEADKICLMDEFYEFEKLLEKHELLSIHLL
jgi:hypothetical protein